MILKHVKNQEERSLAKNVLSSKAAGDVERRMPASAGIFESSQFHMCEYHDECDRSHVHALHWQYSTKRIAKSEILQSRLSLSYDAWHLKVLAHSIQLAQALPL